MFFSHTTPAPASSSSLPNTVLLYMIWLFDLIDTTPNYWTSIFVSGTGLFSRWRKSQVLWSEDWIVSKAAKLLLCFSLHFVLIYVCDEDEAMGHCEVVNNLHSEFLSTVCDSCCISWCLTSIRSYFLQSPGWLFFFNRNPLPLFGVVDTGAENHLKLMVLSAWRKERDRW